jgi:hypothetical protein
MFKRNLRRLLFRFNHSEVKTSVTSSVIWGDFTFRQIGLALGTEVKGQQSEVRSGNGKPRQAWRSVGALPVADC